ncbi:MAG: hypothetical protein PHX08_09620 [Lachnospiraceae bacterium]|nr:hypothetical protein [Lachnospiraceae bacterium]
MRRTVDSIIRIVKQATSKKRIQKLSIEYGVTVRTIKKWVEKYKKGDYETISNVFPSETKSHKKNGIKPFRVFTYTTNDIEIPLKNGNGGVYRHLFKDTSTGYMFCGYSKEKTNAAAAYFFRSFSGLIKKAGYKPEKVMTNADIDEKDNIVEKMKLYDLKKYSSFSLKKNSYIKEREKYEDCSDFIIDSLATVSRNNEIINSELNVKKEKLKKIKLINYKLHYDVFGRENCEIEEGIIKDHLKKCYDKALEFHKKYDFVNADYIYEKLYYILRDTDIDIELLLLVLLQRSKIAGLRQKKCDMRKFSRECSMLLSKNTFEKKDFYLKTFYYILMDQNRISGDKSRAEVYLKKIKEVIKRMNDLHETALFNINAGRLYFNFRMFDKAFQYFDAANDIIKKNDFKDLSVSIEESYADLYNKKGDHEATKKVFKRMIDNGVYLNSPYYRGLLYAKYADQFHLTGDLNKAVKVYDESLIIINKHIDVKVFLHLGAIIESNKAFTLFKMNDYERSKAIFEKNLTLSKENDFKDQIFTNLTYLIMVQNETLDIKGAEKNHKDLALLLKNMNKPEIQNKYFLAKGEIQRNKKNYSAAEENMKKALEITQSKDFPIKASCFDVSLKLLDLYSLTKDKINSEKIADQIIKKAQKNNLPNYAFKAKILKQKCKLFSKNDLSGYMEYLKALTKEQTNDELKCFILKESEKCHK